MKMTVSIGTCFINKVNSSIAGEKLYDFNPIDKVVLFPF